MRIGLLALTLLPGCALFELIQDLTAPPDDLALDTAWDTGGGVEPLNASSSRLTWSSAIAVEPAGDALALPGTDAVFVGMAGAVCRVSWSMGLVGTDYDTDPQWAESIVDTDGSAILSTTPRGWQILRPFDQTQSWAPVRGIVDARLSPHGVVTLAHTQGGCEVAGLDDGAPVVAGSACPASHGFVVDDNTAWVVTPEGTQVVTPDGVRPHPADGDLLARDNTSGLLFTARKGGDKVSAWTDAGELAWAVTVPGHVRAIHVLPGRGTLGVLVRSPQDSRLLWLDTADGSAEEVLSSSQNLSAFSVDPTGRRISVVARGQTHFFDDAGR